MATIEEDYVSLETAKLLREKGFNEPCYTYYDDIDDTINRFDKGYHFNNTSYPWGVLYDVNKAKKYVVAPTLQMAMKWLREVHDLIIYVKLVNDGDLYHDAWGFVIYNKFTEENIKSDKLWFKYEEACEAAIKYCLENLI